MNTLKTIIAASIIATIATSTAVQADELMDIIHPESADLFHYDNSLKASEREATFSLSDVNGDQVWSFEYEEYVSQSDFSSRPDINHSQFVNQYLEANPTASGKPVEAVFKWDSTYDGFMLQ